MLQHPTQKCCNAMSDTPSPHLSSSFATLNAATFSLPFSPLAVTPPLQRIFEDTDCRWCNTQHSPDSEVLQHHVYPHFPSLLQHQMLQHIPYSTRLRHLFQDPNISVRLSIVNMLQQS